MATVNPLVNESTDIQPDFDEWSLEKAVELAAEEGITLTDAHWEVIHYLRRQCERQEGVCNARKVIRGLSERFKAQGGKRYLYSLFPHGPVYQASRIAGIPMPPETLDLSFGSVH